MKKFKIFTLVLAIAVSAAGVFAFTQPGKTEKKFTTYHYTSNSVELEDMQNPENWEGTSPAEGCDVYGSIPCTISTDEDLKVYLESFTDPILLISSAQTRRN